MNPTGLCVRRACDFAGSCAVVDAAGPAGRAAVGNRPGRDGALAAAPARGRAGWRPGGLDRRYGQVVVERSAVRGRGEEPSGAAVSASRLVQRATGGGGGIPGAAIRGSAFLVPALTLGLLVCAATPLRAGAACVPGAVCDLAGAVLVTPWLAGASAGSPARLVQALPATVAAAGGQARLAEALTVAVPAVEAPAVPIRRPALEPAPFSMADLRAAGLVPATQPEAEAGEGVAPGPPGGAATMSLPPEGGGDCPFSIPQYDMDLDGDVDSVDFGFVQGCGFEQGTQPPDPACWYADLDADGDVDGTDMALFLGCDSGPAVRGDVLCGDCNCNGVLDAYEIRWCGDCGINLDPDGDVLLETCDNCPANRCPGNPLACRNTDQSDLDGDGAGDVCDNCTPGGGYRGCSGDACWNPDQLDTDGDFIGDTCDRDDDNDGRQDVVDNCPLHRNLAQEDYDADGVGDACDNCRQTANPDQMDTDRDARGDACDNCPAAPNHDQVDSDGDTAGDACDQDDDNDGRTDGTDNCPTVANVNVAVVDCNGNGVVPEAGEDVGQQCDRDGDGVGDACDVCADLNNPTQADRDDDGAGDSCDNCIDTPNPPNQGDHDCNDDGDFEDGGERNGEQCDIDRDGIGDECDLPGALDADVDSDNNNGRGLPDRSRYEDDIEAGVRGMVTPENPLVLGKVVLVNDDDDDGNGVPDMDDPGAVAGENDLVPLIIEISPAAAGVLDTVPFLIAGPQCEPTCGEGEFPLRLWRTPQRGGPEDLVRFHDPEDPATIHEHVHMIRGDLDLNGLLNQADRDLLATVIADFEGFCTRPPWSSYARMQARAVADVNQDDRLDATDQVMLDRFIAQGIVAPAPLRLWIEGLRSIPASAVVLEVRADADGVAGFESQDTVWVQVLQPEACWYGNALYENLGVVLAGAAVLIEQTCDPAVVGWLDGGCLSDFRTTTDNLGGICMRHETVLNLDLSSCGAGPVDLPPRRQEVSASSSPLVPAEARLIAPPTSLPERAMHHDVVDLATGMPLLQAVDFELPFGGAVFRHVRTYSESPTAAEGAFSAVTDENEPTTPIPEHAYWDWNGLGWMMGENPILLIDSSFYWNHGLPPKIYLIPDAHHAIPFERQGTEYVAPRWFDAVLQHNGVLGDDGRWVQPATEFYVFRHRRSVKYTFEVHDEDVPEWVHEPAGAMEPFAGPCPQYTQGCPVSSTVRRGVPHYALVKRIEDRYGNAVLYGDETGLYYCSAEQYDCDSYESAGCRECCQTCNRKGQLKAVKLQAADGQIVWTILYTYRTFGIPAERIQTRSGSDHLKLDETIFFPRRLHAIHVYQGDVPVPAGCPTVEWEAICGAGTIDNALALDPVDESGNPVLPPASQYPWMIEVRYFYDEFTSLAAPRSCGLLNCYSGGAAPWHEPVCDALGCTETWGGPAGLLQMVRVIRRGGNGQTSARNATYTMYRHEGAPFRMPLSMVLESPTIEAILRAWPEGGRGRMDTPSHLLSLPSAGTTIQDMVPTIDPETAKLVYKPLEQVADLVLREQWDFHGSSEQGGLGGVYPMSAADQAFIRDRLGEDPARTRIVSNRVRTARVRRRTGGGTFHYHLVQVYPSDCAISFNSSDGYGFESQLPHNLYYLNCRGYPWHYPYRYVAGSSPNYHLAELPPGERFFIHVIDEEIPPDGYRRVAYNRDDPNTIRSRRIVELTPAGFILSDRTWTYDRGTGTLVAQAGFSERRIYDDQGRITERRSPGWDVASATGHGTDQGLITVYTYDDDDSGGRQPTRELASVSIKKGIHGTPILLEEYERAITSRPELVTAEKRYPLAGGAPVVTLRTLEFYPRGAWVWKQPDGSYTHDPPVLSEEMIRPAAPALRDGNGQPVDCHPVEKKVFHPNGTVTWTGRGLRRTDNGRHALYFVDYAWNSPFGPMMTVEDVNTSVPIYPQASDVGVTAPPDMARVVPDPVLNPPLNLVTRYSYDPVWGLESVTAYDADGEPYKWTFAVRVPDADGKRMEYWLFKDLIVRHDPGTGQKRYEALAPGTIHTIEGETLLSTRDVKYAAFPPLEGTGPWTVDPAAVEYEVVATTTYHYDENGRPDGVTRTSSDDQTLSASAGYDDEGRPIRSVAPDGTIRHTVYDRFGRIAEIWQGTRDEHVEWGREGPPCAYFPGHGCHEGPYDDNMALTEKRYYGEGVHDAGLLVGTRRYAHQLEQRYTYWDPDANGGAGGFVHPDRSSIGSLTEHAYDWRMREVWVCRRDESGGPLGHSITWYDNLDRVRIVAEYGPAVPALPADLDPRTAPPNANPGQAHIDALMGPGVWPRPLSLTETIYNARGQVEQTRNYCWIDGVGGSPGHDEYTNTTTWYDHADRPVEIRSPGGGIQHYEYDAAGRQRLAWTTADGKTVTRTETSFDGLGRAYKTVSRERRSHDLTTPGLDDSNAVATFSHSWYLPDNKLLAQADYGTDLGSLSDNGTFTFNPAEPVYDPDHLMPGEDRGQKLARYEYDGQGQQSAMLPSHGPATRQEYDDLGRLRLFVENADDPDPARVRRTAYGYDEAGRLSRIAAVLPNHRGGTIAGWQDVDWNAADRTLQVTGFVYAAEVVNLGGPQDGAVVSEHNGWIREVHYPDPATGQPRTTADLTFQYYADGSVATRTDALGVRFTYVYDTLGRRIETRIGLPPSDLELNALNPIRRIGCAYTSDGRITRVTAYDEQDNILSESLFEYDGRGNLLAEHQSHGGAVAIGTTPAVEYAWAYSAADAGVPGGGGNYDRLAMIRYPRRPEVGSQRRELTFDYAPGLDSALGRVSAILDSELGQVAAYTYMGTGRRVGVTLAGGAISQTVAGAGGCPGLDRFGRIRDLHYVLAGGATANRHEYGHDLAGNRVFDKVTQAPEPGTPPAAHDNDRSWRYGYDGLNQLIAADFGRLGPDHASIVPDPGEALGRCRGRRYNPASR